MARKAVPFNRTGIERLPDDKPVVYKIETENGRNNYTGVAQRGRVRERLAEHLPGSEDFVPESRVVIEQMSSTAEARQKEQRIIEKSQPKYNNQEKWR